MAYRRSKGGVVESLGIVLGRDRSPSHAQIFSPPAI